jgi:hypothetical protein
LKGGFFLMKKPLEGVLSVGINSENAVGGIQRRFKSAIPACDLFQSEEISGPLVIHCLFSAVERSQGIIAFCALCGMNSGI